jgi:RNA polymerase sigma-70 factor (ECF subfamily)
LAARSRRLAPLEDEAELVERACAGDRAAFDRLATHHRSWLERTAALLLGDPEQAEDLVQAALGIAFAQIGSFERRSELSTWLCGIVLNLARRELRRRARHAGTLSPELLDARPASSERTRGPLSSVLRRELTLRIEDAVARLPIPLREGFLLRFVSGLDYEQIAAAAGISVATARVRAFRARALLRADLGAVVDTVWLEGDPRGAA